LNQVPGCILFAPEKPHLNVRKNRALTSVEILDLSNGTWTAGPELPLGLHGVPAVSTGGVLYVIGGSDRPGAISNQGLVYALNP